MKKNQSLDPIFHERSRLSIMTVLAANASGVAFTELRDLCKLTDGNLSRHLHKLAEVGLVSMEKRFRGGIPNTTIQVTSAGLDQFSRYVEELEQIVAEAQRAVRGQAKEVAEARHGMRTQSDKSIQELKQCPE
jgi:DNA-binding transcriptional ArsR family regulator